SSASCARRGCDPPSTRCDLAPAPTPNNRRDVTTATVSPAERVHPILGSMSRDTQVPAIGAHTVIHQSTSAESAHTAWLLQSGCCKCEAQTLRRGSRSHMEEHHETYEYDSDCLSLCWIRRV